LLLLSRYIRNLDMYLKRAQARTGAAILNLE
jgi:hypothetical protein